MLAVLVCCSSDSLSTAALFSRGHGDWSRLAVANFGRVAVAPLVGEAWVGWWQLCRTTTNYGVSTEGLGCGIHGQWCVKLSLVSVLLWLVSIRLDVVNFDRRGCDWPRMLVFGSLPLRQPTDGGSFKMAARAGMLVASLEA